MTTKLHFISGLPRSGSTLLSALLRQNPRFHAGITGPVGSLVESLLKTMSMANETSVFISDDQRQRVLRSIFDAFYGALPPDDVAFDTNRMWCEKMALLGLLFPQARVICCVRDVASIVESVERLVRANALQPSGIFNFDPAGSVYSRAEGLGSGNGLIGYAYNALRQAFYGPGSERLLLVRYETLATDPGATLAEIYRFIGEPPFEHDFANVEFDAGEFDRRLGTPGLHSVKRAVIAPAPRPTLLPPDLLHKYSQDNFWLNPSANPNGVRIV